MDTNLSHLITEAQLRQRERLRSEEAKRLQDEAERNDQDLRLFRKNVCDYLGADFLDMGILQLSRFGPGVHFRFCGFSYGVFFEWRFNELSRYFIIRREADDGRFLGMEVRVTTKDETRDQVFCAIAELAGLEESRHGKA